MKVKQLGSVYTYNHIRTVLRCLSRQQLFHHRIPIGVASHRNKIVGLSKHLMTKVIASMNLEWTSRSLPQKSFDRITLLPASEVRASPTSRVSRSPWQYKDKR